jgi:hypothetical protein
MEMILLLDTDALGKLYIHFNTSCRLQDWLLKLIFSELILNGLLVVEASSCLNSPISMETLTPFNDFEPRWIMRRPMPRSIHIQNACYFLIYTWTCQVFILPAYSLFLNIAFNTPPGRFIPLSPIALHVSELFLDFFYRFFVARILPDIVTYLYCRSPSCSG